MGGQLTVLVVHLAADRLQHRRTLCLQIWHKIRQNEIFGIEYANVPTPSGVILLNANKKSTAFYVLLFIFTLAWNQIGQKQNRLPHQVRILISSSSGEKKNNTMCLKKCRIFAYAYEGTCVSCLRTSHIYLRLVAIIEKLCTTFPM